ncbi:phosphoenolpyruvate--protein phosphotransferase [Vallitalea pronyensis]|uniref:Phosphoenolpyruvate-protein phosphotransferase n=1 Tax=Vallitalea pronyensis TaxID=1348613 RepID=A0A8J8MQI0_9FIRM|nr:phosphoenolpyruvate--protein phosphotransferase [Vallitalea pronyensis]QUI25746.1 phosphoenolpyruvate--protein phosphotransferase [Vallitalea pronyensis]
MLKGIAASNGFAIGKAFLMTKKGIHIDEEKAESMDDELNRLRDTVSKTLVELDNIYNKTKIDIGDKEAMIFESHKMMLEDPEYIAHIKKNIQEKQHQVPYAIQKATDFYVDIFEKMDNPYMRERAVDIKDVADRMIRISLGESTEICHLTDQVILIARDLTPSDTAELDKSKVKAFVTQVGSTTSHSAIMAHSMGIPAVVGCQLVDKISDGDLLIVDGFTGNIIINPEKKVIQAYERQLETYQEEVKALKKYKPLRFNYTSGRHVSVAGNIGSIDDLELLLEQGTEGIGLFRTEFLFMGRTEMPSEEEQFEIYKHVAETMKDKPVIIRTLDIGGDKIIPYMNMPDEENPFMGLRALRLCFKEIEVFKTQLRAILRAGYYGNIHIMFPMIGAMDELLKAKTILETCKHTLLEQGIPLSNHLPVGMMIEIPAAAICARDFAKEVDFFSIGTNDLIQYTLAVDRMNVDVSGLYNPYHPGVLHLIQSTIQAAHEAGIWCGMCGEMASDIEATSLLAKMELDEFSVTGNAILKIKEQLSYQTNITVE